MAIRRFGAIGQLGDEPYNPRFTPHVGPAVPAFFPPRRWKAGANRV